MEEGPVNGLTHVDAAGRARMVDVSGKDVTARPAGASGRVLLSAEAVTALRAGEVPKGDALAVARIAGIAGAKRTPDLIPLCHPIGLHGLAVEVAVTDEDVGITAVARTADRTGVEMEALTAVSVTGLALIDMVKAIDPAAVITDVRVDWKQPGMAGFLAESAHHGCHLAVFVRESAGLQVIEPRHERGHLYWHAVARVLVRAERLPESLYLASVHFAPRSPVIRLAEAEAFELIARAGPLIAMGNIKELKHPLVRTSPSAALSGTSTRHRIPLLIAPRMPPF